MEDLDLRELENFETVWRRVQGEDMPPAPAKQERDTDGLQSLLDEKYGQTRLLSALSRHFQGGIRQGLQQLAAEERKQYRFLEMHYFLLTGRRHRPMQNGTAFSGGLTGLRMAWQREKDFSALTAQSGALPEETLQIIAAEDEKHAAQIYALIRKIMLG